MLLKARRRRNNCARIREELKLNSERTKQERNIISATSYIINIETNEVLSRRSLALLYIRYHLLKSSIEYDDDAVSITRV